MIKRLVCAILFLFVCFSASPIYASEIAVAPEKNFIVKEEYIPSSGDYMLADVEQGIGYMVNDEKKHFTAFPLLSGQKRYVCYIGRCYYAETPERSWVIKQKDVKGDRVTFGKTGEFLRLFHNDRRTAYGIHNYKYFQKNLEKGNRYVSMGCLLVSEEILDLIEKSFIANGNELRVTTQKQIESL